MPSREYHEALWERLPEGLDPPDLALRRSFLLEHVRAGQRVLDVGCADGRLAGELAELGAQVVGIDVAEEPLRRARERHPGMDLRLVEAEGTWDLPDGAFDVVWAGEVVEHVADTAAWLSQVRRVLRSGGALLLSTPAHGRGVLLGLALSRRASAERLDPLSDHLRFYTRATLTGLLEDFRFQEVEVRAAGGPPWGRRVLLARAVRARF
jgi:2-polyprenyl-3-methyl-5-hydroxy-6-metoxy-1,4-benzoquinol methylase